MEGKQLNRVLVGFNLLSRPHSGFIHIFYCYIFTVCVCRLMKESCKGVTFRFFYYESYGFGQFIVQIQRFHVYSFHLNTMGLI